MNLEFYKSQLDKVIFKDDIKNVVAEADEDCDLSIPDILAIKEYAQDYYDEFIMEANERANHPDDELTDDELGLTQI